ncbi:oxidative stress survival, Svf1-like protein [Fimicolochytrium jonesii]|uniref:oxidative stress survival, Svf1-like protein n=1 Tax=Fimicolochytrium jonesii TaxID=1396493 RepID=UPI0022FE0905|nr:oxidative stress survival, Svf1-like protein [Fimicolochytrium jonesii]KAI8818281.1 oxidative stress survival, Svf1-like protein [Fimicolochytrium jonesii]
MSTNVVATSDVSLGDLEWVQDPSYATEANTFYIHADDGAFAIVQIAYSTMSWSPSVQVSAAYHGADGFKKRHTATLSGGSFKPTDDKLSVQCENIKVTFDAERKAYKVSLHAAPAFMADFEFVAVDGFSQVNGGKHPFKAADPAAGYVQAQFIPKAKVTGHITTDGKLHDISGSGLFVKAIQKVPQCVARWSFVDFQNEKDALLMYQFEMPDGYDYDFRVRSEGYIVLNNKTIAVTLDNFTKILNTSHDPFSGYEIPSAAEYKWSGLAKDGRAIHIDMKVPLNRLLDKIDLLGELPYLIRKFIQTFLTAPFVYQWFEEATANVTIGEEKLTLKGRVFHENAFLAALPN